MNSRVRISWIDTEINQEGIYEESYLENSGSVWLESTEMHDNWNLFMWQDGNYSCDCNREAFFLETDIRDTKCGSDRFVIKKLEVWDPNKNEWIDQDYNELE